MHLPYPQHIFDDVTGITMDFLRSRGIRGLLLDIDGTLMPTHVSAPRPPVLAWLEEMRKNGIVLYVLSNNRHPGRVAAFAQPLGLPWQDHAGKPKRAGFDRAFGETGLRPEELAVVGDQIYTDMWGARRWGCQALMVQSTDTALWYFPFRRLAELPFRKEKD